MAAQYGGHHFDKSFQPIRVVLLIANGGHPMEAAIFKAELHSEKGGESNFSATHPRQYPEHSPGVVSS